jgi:hypothetical protein
MTIKQPICSTEDHHHYLDWALWKYGFRRNELTAHEFHLALREMSPATALELHYTNPYSQQLWRELLQRAMVARGLHTGPLLMATILDHRWHFAWGRWELDLPAILTQARTALASVPHLLLLEFAPLVYYGHRQVAPHLQGFVFADLSRRHRRRLASHFAGGLGGARALMLKRVHDFAGACSYSVKLPDHVETCFAGSGGRRVHRGRALWLSERYFLWRHLSHHTYPDFTLAGGAGTRVLRLALRDAEEAAVRRWQSRFGPRSGAALRR